VNSCDVVVVGAGISGLACAFNLQRAGMSTTVLEAGLVPGGKIISKQQDGYLMELGPSSMLRSFGIDELINDLDLEPGSLRVRSREHPRFIFDGQGLEEVPSGPWALAMSKLLSWQAKLDIIKEVFITKRMSQDLSLAEFTRVHLGEEVLDKLVAPFVSGIHAGDAESLSLEASFPRIAKSAREYGSVIRGFLWDRISGRAKSRVPVGLCSFQQGLGVLPTALAKELGQGLLLGAKVISINPLPEGRGFTISYSQSDRPAEPLICRYLVLAIGPGEAAVLTADFLPAVRDVLESIRQTPMVVAQVGMNLSSLKVRPKGFGFLVPRDRGVRCLGVLWTSSVFPGRSPQGHALMTLFYGGALDPGAFELGDQELQEVIGKDLGKTMGWDGISTLSFVHRIKHALPAFELGHVQKIESLRRNVSESGHPLRIIGNYVAGISIPDCVELAAWTAKDIATMLKTA